MNYELISKPNKSVQPIVQVLINRGLKNEDINHFLHTSNEDIYSPDLLDNLLTGVKMLISHIYAKDKIYIQVDSDCDGMTSSAFLINYLNELFPNYTQTNIIYGLHNEKSHGISMETIPSDVKLIIIPDAGSNEIETHEQYYKQGIDILVLDHHKANSLSPYACIINNQLCDYPTKSLSGVGIVYKFCSKIDELLGYHYADKFLDLVALGLIADVMDTRDFETQHLIQEGLKDINNPLFKELINRDAMHFKSDKIYMIDVAWYVAPFINAVTRVGTLEEKILTFEAMLNFRAYEQIPSTKRGCKGQFETRVEQAGRQANNIKNRQNIDVDNGIAYVNKHIEANNLDQNKVIIITIQDKDILNKNLNGLVANKIASQYQRPALILQKNFTLENEIIWEGSMRGYEKSGLKDFQKFLQSSNLIEYVEGHPSAAGVGILDQNIQKLNDYCNLNLSNFDGNIKYDVDFIWRPIQLNIDDVLALAQYKELWGQKVEEPQIALENVKLSANNVRFLGKTGKTLRIDLPNISIIKMYMSDEEKEYFDSIDSTGAIIANMIVTCDINEWNGNVYPQFKLIDMEIVKQIKWDF